MELDLYGRVAVVTGASRGIGLAVTRTLLAEGARVVATSRNRSAELDALNGELVHVPADMTDPRAPAEAIARAVETFGRLDVLVNNAGGPPPGRLADPQEIADAVVMLASPRSASTTGTELIVDSGMLKSG